MPDAPAIPDSVGSAVDRRGVGARRWWALGALVMGGLAVGLDATVLSVALPTLARQSIFGAVAVADQIHSPALLMSAHSAFVHGMDLALVVSSAVALVGVALTVVFLPQVNVSKEVAKLPVEQEPAVVAVT